MPDALSTTLPLSPVSAVPRVPAVPLKLTEGDGLCVAGIRIGVVGEHVSSGRRAAGAVESAALLGGVARTGTAVGAPFGVDDTVMLKVSLAARLPRSLAVPRTAIVPDIGGCRRAAEGPGRREPKGQGRTTGGGRRQGAHTLLAITAQYLRGGPRTDSQVLISKTHI